MKAPQHSTSISVAQQSAEERIEILEAQVAGLTEICSMLLTAHTLSCNDNRVIPQLSKRAKECFERSRSGGTSYFSTEFLAARGETLLSVLEASQGSGFTSSYWKRSVFPWIDERRYSKIDDFEDFVMDAINAAQE
ncbi:hypothetical protein Q4560_06255 [Celeribacter halophilus]|uniref:Uncharacterized protein n=1 Tax=Celeribacter halophilus TaxID=576117 RepID=A0AAW7XU92_9RHOB|nr:hypothetical protein [Celeribacter halophilus]MDO6456398.1 hypothetical protein [Celeribacter halophilus]MDO6722861.1 hypothetical protein [Celeribacter halophilus]